MRLYELVLVLKTKLTDADRKKIIESIKGWLGDVKLTKQEDMGQKPLAYPIKKEVAGYYAVLHLEGETISSEVERRIIQSEDVLRHLLIRTK